MSSNGTICVYGRTKVGKTSDVLYMFRDAFVIVTERGALAPVTHQFGYTPAHVEMLTSADPYVDMVNLIDKCAVPAIASGKHNAVFLDSGTALSAMIFGHLDRKWRSDGRKIYPTHDLQFKDIMARLLALPAWIIVSFHEAEPIATDVAFVRGGPKTSGSKKLVEDIGGMFRLILRGVVEGNRRMYHCNSLDPQWIQGDAYGVAAVKQDMDLRPIVWRLLRPGQDVPAQFLTQKPFRTVAEENGGGDSLL